MEDRFGELRSLAHEAPSAAAWAMVQRELGRAARQGAAGRRFVEDVATPYLQNTLGGWPDALRVASVEDARALLAEPGQAPLSGAAPLARALRLDLVAGHHAGLVGEAREAGATLHASLMRRLDDALRTITHLTIHRTREAPLQLGVLVSALTLGAHTSRLRSLELSQRWRGEVPLRGRELGPLVRSGKLARLRALDLSGCAYGPELVDALASGPLDALERLDLASTSQDERSVQVLAQTPLAGQLTWLNLQRNRAVQGPGLRALLDAAPRLRALLLWGARLDEDDARALAARPLDVLDLSGVSHDADVLDACLDALEPDHPLEDLRFADAAVSDAGLVALMRARLPRLRALVMWGTPCAEALALMPQRAPWWSALERLSLGAQDGLHELLAQPAPMQLRRLGLAHARLHEGVIPRMITRGWFAHLEGLEIARDALNDATLDALAAARWGGLRELRLYTEASAASWGRLLDALASQGVGLEVLVLSGRMSADAALSLLAHHPTTRRLHTLELSGLFGGAEQLSEATVDALCDPEALPALRVLRLAQGVNPHLRERLRERLDLWQCT